MTSPISAHTHYIASAHPSRKRAGSGSKTTMPRQHFDDRGAVKASKWQYLLPAISTVSFFALTGTAVYALLDKGVRAWDRQVMAESLFYCVNVSAFPLAGLRCWYVHSTYRDPYATRTAIRDTLLRPFRPEGIVVNTMLGWSLPLLSDYIWSSL